MNLGRRKPVTAAELLARLHSDPDWVRRNREREEARAARDAKLYAEIRPEEAPILRDLWSIGRRIESVWDLVNTKERYPEAVPILAGYLPRVRHPKLREAIARALTVAEARGEPAKVLLRELMTTIGEDFQVSFALANALATAGDVTMVGALSDLRADPRFSELAPVLDLVIQKIEMRTHGRKRKRG